MRFRLMRPLLAAGILLAATASGGSAPTEPPMTIGVTTHFGQGWPESYWALLEALPAAIVRDAIGWRKIETVKGKIEFTPDAVAHVDRLCGLGRRVLLVLEPRHPLYDDGLTIHSPDAVAAFARYTKAVADRFGTCLAGFEIGNEINARNNMTGPAAMARPAAHTAILRAVHAAVKPGHPEVQILGGSSHSIATGFIDRLLAAGAGSYLDAVAVHPYRRDPANLDWELDRLRAAMTARGVADRLWVTEFSRDFASPEEAPDFLVKMAVLMSAAGIEHANWYALIDQPGFPTMGLFTLGRQPKPVAAAFSYVATELLSKARGVHLNRDQSDVVHVRFGSERQVLWGGPRAFSVHGEAVFRDAAGARIDKPDTIGDSPLIIEGAVDVRLGPRSVLADSLYDYAEPPWQYIARRGTTAASLGPIDWQWTSYVGSSAVRPLAVNPLGIVAGANALKPLTVMLRYTAPEARRIFASACLSKPVNKAGEIAFAVAQGDQTLRAAKLTDQLKVVVPIDVEAGDAVDFVLGPLTRSTAGAVLYRFRISATPAAAAPC